MALLLREEFYAKTYIGKILIACVLVWGFFGIFMYHTVSNPKDTVNDTDAYDTLSEQGYFTFFWQ